MIKIKLKHLSHIFCINSTLTGKSTISGKKRKDRVFASIIYLFIFILGRETKQMHMKQAKMRSEKHQQVQITIMLSLHIAQNQGVD